MSLQDQTILARNLAKCHTIQLLSLDNCDTQAQTLKIFINCLPSLHSLLLKGSSPRYSPGLLCTRGRLPLLKSLCIDSYHPTTRVLLPPDSFTTLQSLELLQPVVYDPKVNLNISSDNLQSLHTLRVDFGQIRKSDGPAPLLQDCDPQHLKALRRVHLASLNMSKNHVIISFLSKISVLPIEEIVLGVSFDYIWDFKPAAYAELNQAFARPAFEHLTSVRFVYKGSIELKRVRHRLKQAFPSLALRGIGLELGLSKFKSPNESAFF